MNFITNPLLESILAQYDSLNLDLYDKEGKGDRFFNTKFLDNLKKSNR